MQRITMIPIIPTRLPTKSPDVPQTATNPAGTCPKDAVRGAMRQPARLSMKIMSMMLLLLLSLYYSMVIFPRKISMQDIYDPKPLDRVVSLEQLPASNRSHVDELTLPTCKDLMQQPHSPYVSGSFLTQISTDIVWKMRRDGSRELTLPSTCRLKRYTSNEAKQCLKGKSLLFIGDSLTRYNYLSLAYFLEYDRWPYRFSKRAPQYCMDLDKESCSKLGPNICAEGDWGGWPDYLKVLGGNTDGGMFHGKMEVTEVRKLNGGSYEYISSSEHGQTTLRYAGEIGWGGTEPYRGYKFTGCAKNATCRYTAKQYDLRAEQLADDNGFEWQYDSATHAFGSNGTDFLQQYAGTDYAVYNRGIWGKLPKDRAKIFMDSLYKLSGGKEKQQSRCFYRSTTSCERSTKDNMGSYEYNTIRAVAYEANCEYLDYNHITKALGQFHFRHPKPDRNLAFERSSVLWDAVHYQPWVYEELNNLLLNVLCNANQGF